MSIVSVPESLNRVVTMIPDMGRTITAPAGYVPTKTWTFSVA